MGFGFVIFLALWIAGFLAMFVSYAPVTEKYLKTLNFKLYMLPFPYILFYFACGSIGAYFLTDNTDFIEPINALRIALPIILAAAIYLMSMLSVRWLFAVLVTVCVSAVVLIQPIGGGSAFPSLPIWLIQALTIIFGVIYCLGYSMMNSTPQALIIPSVMTLLGLCILSGIGAAPVYSAYAAAVFTGVLVAYLGVNFHADKIDLDNGACTAIAFLIFSLLVLQLGEFSFPSCMIFTAVFWAELAFALWHKYVVSRTGTLQENTNYYLAGLRLDFNALGLNISKICIITLFLGWFQLFSVNHYSLFLIALVIALWLNSSLGQNENAPQGIKEINREFVKNLKQSLKEAKDVISQSRNKEN